MKLTIFIENLRLQGVHGMTEKEKHQAQPFCLDLSVTTDGARVGHDAIEATVDYRRLKVIAEHEVCERSYELLETLAFRIGSQVMELSGVRDVTVSVRKTAIWKWGVPGVTLTLP